MNKFFIIPRIKQLDESLALSRQYGLGFEFNDFFFPDVLDDDALVSSIVNTYKKAGLPDYCTSHGDFFDVLVFSDDKEIRRISEKRIRQSIAAAQMIGAKAVVFHTNINPDIKTDAYLNNWLERNEMFWSRILPEYPDINIYLENMFDNDPLQMKALCERLSSFDNFGVCYDYAHAHVFSDSPDEWTKQLLPFTKHFHINDNDFKEDSHLALGDGMIDWQKFFAECLQKAPDATVLIETSSIENQKKSIDFLIQHGIQLN